MDQVSTPPPAATLLASGEQPDWRLLRRGDDLWLVERGRAPVRASGIRVRRTPFDARMGARTADGGVLMLAWTFGACRAAQGAPRGSYIATVTFGSRTLSGCYAGMPPGERPLLD